MFGIISFDYYHQFFQVTTNEVLLKLFFSLTIIFYKKFKKMMNSKMDFYGPIWIFITMIVSLSISQNLYSYLTKPDNEKYRYSIEYLPTAFIIVFVMGFIIPLFFNIMLRAFGGVISYSMVVTVYGYS